jgi:hypothetical protein
LVRLGLVRLGLVRLGLVMLGLVRLGLVNQVHVWMCVCGCVSFYVMAHGDAGRESEGVTGESSG